MGEQREVAGIEGLLNLTVQSEHAGGFGLGGVGGVERCFLVHVGGDPCAEVSEAPWAPADGPSAASLAQDAAQIRLSS